MAALVNGLLKYNRITSIKEGPLVDYIEVGNMFDEPYKYI
jgi:hypothetical protein